MFQRHDNSHCPCDDCLTRRTQESVDRSVIIGILQRTYALQRQIWQPFFVPIGTTVGGTFLPIFTAPRLQRVQFRNVVMSTTGAGDTIAALALTGEGTATIPQPPLAQAGQFLCFYYMKQQFSFFPVPDFEVQSGGVLNIITPQAGTTNSLFVFGNYRILDNLSPEMMYGRRP